VSQPTDGGSEQPEQRVSDVVGDLADQEGLPQGGPAEITPDAPLTGDAAVDEATAAVARAVTEPLEDQVTVIEAAHRVLTDRLADVEG
jgi:hypothetical protein